MEACVWKRASHKEGRATSHVDKMPHRTSLSSMDNPCGSPFKAGTIPHCREGVCSWSVIVASLGKDTSSHFHPVAMVVDRKVSENPKEEIETLSRVLL